jgi:hypothetical protein
MAIPKTKCGGEEVMRLAELAFISGAATLYAFSDGQPIKQVAGSGSDKAQPALSPRVTARGSLAFIENRGQFDAEVKFRAQSGGKVLWFTDKGIVFDVVRPADGRQSAAIPAPSHPRNGSPPDQKLQRLVFSEAFTNGHAPAQIEASIPNPEIYNYFIGNDPKKWRTGVVSYSQLIYRDVWPGIDVRFAANGADIEREFLVHPGADPSEISAYSGVNGLQTPGDGSMVVHTTFGPLRESSPRIYQEIAGHRNSVHGSYKVSANFAYTFQLGLYDKQHALVIDPTLLFSTYIGGIGSDVATGIAVDPAGNSYVTGSSRGTSYLGYPTTPGAFQAACSNFFCTGAVVSKFDPLGRLVYSTYLASPSGGDVARGIAVDANGEAYVAGAAYLGFPTTTNAFQNGGCDGSFMTKLNATGTALLYSTCLGYDAAGLPYGVYAAAIALDANARAYVTGSTSDTGFPTTSDAFQPALAGATSAFLSVVDPSLSGTASLVYSTHLGGEVEDWGSAIAVDAYGSGYITGHTWSSHFPVTPNAFQSVDKQSYCLQGPEGGFRPQCATGFVAKLNPKVAGAVGLIYSSYLGGNVGNYHPQGVDGSGDYPAAIAVDSSGSAYVGGWTDSLDFPTTTAAFQPSSTCGHVGSGFVTKVNPGGSGLAYSTFIGGTSCTAGVAGIALDSSGNAYITGETGSPGFPITPDAFQSSIHLGGGYGYDVFLTELAGGGSSLVYSSYLGGSCDDTAAGVAVDVTGDVYVVGSTCSTDFPVTPFAYQPAISGATTCGSVYSPCTDFFVTKFPLGAPGGLSITGIEPNSGGNAGTVSPEILGSGFHAGATVQLNCGGQPIIGTSVTVGAGGRLLDNTFDLTTASPGICDVVLKNPDGTSATLTKAFTVQQGGVASFRVTKLGTPARKPARVGAGPTDVTYVIAVSNIGNINGSGVVSEDLHPEFSLTSVSPQAIADVPTLAANSLVLWPVPLLAAGGSQRFIYSTIVDPATPLGATLVGPACFIAKIPGCNTCMVTIPPTCHLNTSSSCGIELTECAVESLKCILELPELEVPALAPLAIASCAQAVLSCNAYSRSCIGCAPGDVHAVDCLVANADTCSYYIEQLAGGPADPNALVGPGGVGAPRWISGGPALPYVVSFGNEADATSPAQQVVVTQTIDVSDDLSALSLAGFTIPNGAGAPAVLIPVPPGSFNPAVGLNEFATTVDLRPTQNLLVAVDAKLDPATATLTSTFASIDPATGLPPPFGLSMGFLPPGAGGSVLFTIRPKPGLTTGTKIPAQGSVVFNTNKPVSTNVWANSIDNTAPTSKVSPLPLTESTLAFPVSWAGTDIGSGIGGYTLYVSDNGGPFAAWLTNTTTTKSNYAGVLGHTYAFYSIATDLVGNIETAKTTAEATTTVQGPSTCATDISSQITITRGGFRFNHATSSFVQTVTLTNNGTALSGASLILDNLSAAATLNGSGGTTQCDAPLGSPWISIPGTLAAGQSISLTLTFSDPTQAGIQYSTRVLGGNGQQ